MDKYGKQMNDFYERLKHTLGRCAGVLMAETDEELLWLVYEELDADVPSDLCEGNLEILLKHNYIYPEIADMIVQLREIAIELIKKKQSAAEIRNSAKWHSAIGIAEAVLEMLYI